MILELSLTDALSIARELSNLPKQFIRDAASRAADDFPDIVRFEFSPEHIGVHCMEIVADYCPNPFEHIVPGPGNPLLVIPYNHAPKKDA